MPTSFYVLETRVEHARTCEICGSGMDEGYLHEESGSTYCRLKCALDDSGDSDGFANDLETGELFWTTWHDEVEGSG